MMTPSTMQNLVVSHAWMKTLVFYAVFFLMFLVGGFLNYFGILNYKMILGASLPLFLLPFIRIRVNSFLLMSALFLLVILSSAIVNETSVMLVLWFIQNLAFPVLMFVLASACLNSDNIKKAFRWIILIASIQAPILLIQRWAYPVLSRFAKVDVAEVDIGFGTFYTSDDTALSFFVLGTILFLLLDERHSYFVKNRMLIVVWLTLTILMVNSKISFLILSMIWGYYLVTRIRVRILLYSLMGTVVVFLMVYLTPLHRLIDSNVSELMQQLAFNIDPANAKIFYETAQGNRPAALIHLASEPLKYVGEGPHALYDPILNKFNKGGDSGQLIGFYVDLGLVGLIISYAMMYAITRGPRSSEFTKLYWIVLCIFSAVSNIFLDASIMLIFAIFCHGYLIPEAISERSPEPVADKKITSI
jgi:hypothetical protein